MRILLLFPMLGFCSCIHNSATSFLPAKKDSVPSYEQSKKIIDTVAEKRAFEDLMFGTTRKELPKNKRLFFTVIGTTRYEVYPLVDDSLGLYSVRISSSPEPANYYDTKVKRSYDHLVKTIIQKYGSTDNDFGFPAIKYMQPGMFHFGRVWHIGNKTIKIGIGQKEDPEYYAACWIIDEKLSDAINDTKMKKADTKINQDAQRF